MGSHDMRALRFSRTQLNSAQHLKLPPQGFRLRGGSILGRVNIHYKGIHYQLKYAVSVPEKSLDLL